MKYARLNMQQQYLEHPADDALERFLLHQCAEEELEHVETHILACEACVERLESLGLYVAAQKIALAEFTEQKNQPAQRQAVRKQSWLGAFVFPGLTWAGAVAGCALCVMAFLPAQVNLAAYRGIQTTAAPEWRPLHTHLNATDLPDGPVAIQLVDANGHETWKGRGVIRHEAADVNLPRINRRGNYFLRLYSAKPSPDPEDDLLREFTFQVK